MGFVLPYAFTIASNTDQLFFQVLKFLEKLAPSLAASDVFSLRAPTALLRDHSNYSNQEISLSPDITQNIYRK